MSEASIIRGLKDEKAAQLIRLYGNALREAERFMAYFAGETQGHFAGPGTPADCLAQIRQALLVDYDLNFRVGDKVYKKGGDYQMGQSNMKTESVTSVRYHRTKECAPNAHWIIKFLWNQMNIQQVSQQVVGRRSGLDPMVLRRWRVAKHSPKMLNVEAVLNVLGWELCVRQIKEKSDDTGRNNRRKGKRLEASPPSEG